MLNNHSLILLLLLRSWNNACLIQNINKKNPFEQKGFVSIDNIVDAVLAMLSSHYPRENKMHNKCEETQHRQYGQEKLITN